MSNVAVAFQEEVDQGERFQFGANWARFLTLLDDERIVEAEASLKAMLEVDDLNGKTFLDIGSGSGLFSLAARRLGAKVVSFDYDTQSVGCTQELKARFFNDDPNWTIMQGSVLEADFVSSLGQFDIVYSWGVLHHTGAMYQALENAVLPTKQGGKLFIALYNDQRFVSKYWTFVKKSFIKHKWTQPFFIGLHFLYPVLPSMLLKMVRSKKPPRGMSYYYDLLDWLGGYPFEVSKPEEILAFYRARGFNLTRLITVGGRMGCNEFVFEKNQ